MIRLTDTTLTHIPSVRNSDLPKIRQFCRLIYLVGADYIEMPASLYEQIFEAKKDLENADGTLFPATAPQNTNGIFPPARTPSSVLGFPPSIMMGELPLVLHIDLSGQMQSFPEISRFVCRSCEPDPDPRLVCEKQMNDIREINRLHNVHRHSRVRVKGLDDVLLKDYIQVFTQLHSYLGKDCEFCPEDSYGTATASAVEWANFGGSYLATSFGGIGNCAPTEEVLMALRINKRHHPNHDMTVMPQLKLLFEEMTGVSFSRQKPILGSRIFRVEAGIHADGIEKDPLTYEPYEPESVGTTRALVVGKHSGTKAIEIKLSQLQIPYFHDELLPLLRMVQSESLRVGRSLTDEEFVQIVRRI